MVDEMERDMAEEPGEKEKREGEKHNIVNHFAAVLLLKTREKEESIIRSRGHHSLPFPFSGAVFLFLPLPEVLTEE